jgi:DNA/RNA-binding domain of Phe-tRNA-synthetase-like protein
MTREVKPAEVDAARVDAAKVDAAEVDAAIWALRPDFVALSIVVRGGRNDVSDVSLVRVSRATPRHVWADEHLAAWREAYKAFGAKPQRTPCSAEALWRRVERDGALTPISAVVDLYNEVSVRYAVPVGGEDLAAYVGPPRLVRASGGELFETLRDGQAVIEPVDAGEVIWRDEKGVTCRRWNWRQTPRTRLHVTSTDMWFVLERLAPMPVDLLHEAGDALVAGLARLAPDAVVTTAVIRAP